MIIKPHIHAKSVDTMKDIHKSHKMDMSTHFKTYIHNNTTKLHEILNVNFVG